MADDAAHAAWQGGEVDTLAARADRATEVDRDVDLATQRQFRRPVPAEADAEEHRAEGADALGEQAGDTGQNGIRVRRERDGRLTGTGHVDDWRGRLEHWARENERVFHTHPWALPLVTARHVVGPNEIGWLEAALDAVSGIGLTPSEMLEVVLLINAYARGNAPTGTEPAADPTAEARGWATMYERIFDRESARDRYPTVAGLYDAGTFAHRENSFGLTRILDGIQTYIENSASDKPATP